MAVAAAKRSPRVFREKRHTLNNFNDAELVKRYCLDSARCHFKGRKLLRWSLLRRKSLPSWDISPLENCNSAAVMTLGPSQQTIGAIIKQTVYALTLTSLDVMWSGGDYHQIKDSWHAMACMVSLLLRMCSCFPTSSVCRYHIQATSGKFISQLKLYDFNFKDLHYYFSSVFINCDKMVLPIQFLQCPHKH